MPGRRALLITNAAAGQSDKAAVTGRVARALAAGGYEIEIAATGRPGHATELARQGAAAGCAAVFALGGDGTLREAAAGLAGTGVPLGPLPGGTTNVLVRALGLSPHPLTAALEITRHAPRPLAAGWAGDRLFLMQISAGLDAHVLATLDPRWKRRFGQAYIAAAGLRRFWGYGYAPIEAETDGGERLRGSFLAVSNIPLYGGAFRLAPAARTDRPGFELVALGSSGRLATLGFAFDLFRGRHLRRRDLAVRTVHTVRLTGAPTIDLQLDGDICPQRLPIEVRPVEEELLVLAPRVP